MIRLKDIKIHINSKEDLYNIICNKLSLKINEINSLKIYKKSIDARDKENIYFVYTIDLDIVNENRFKSKIVKKNNLEENIVLKRASKIRPVVVGAGPARTFCCS